jgi:hypothetical protein
MFSTGFNLSSVIPSINLTTITSFTTQKALFPMDNFTKAVLKAFDAQGVDLRNAVIDDAPQKLFITAANLTTRRTVFFTGKVSTLDALRASSDVPIEVEVRTFDELNEALSLNIARIMLDHFNLDDMKRAVEIAAGRTPLEASGNMTIERIPAVAATGVDFISVGALTHSVTALYISFTFDPSH